ncbi:MAG: hypothetical protein QOI74_2105 [Micromonosporaceae bacterium]|nr:hypothetical protein [Micromonosporaceae bacterium]MDT5038840.1 hypothetical protein [Micromonosporaceae bacterium]
MSDEPAPRYVLASATDATAVLRRLAGAGWHTREGFALPEPGWDVTAGRLVLFGRVPDRDTAELALLAAARGAGVVAITDIRAELGRALTADLERIGPVSTEPDTGPARTAESAGHPGGTRLAPEQQALLERLAGGETIAAAAQAEFLSLRTANRRIAEARAALGVRSTREAVLAYLRIRRRTP